MGPCTLEALQAELEQLMLRSEADKDLYAPQFFGASPEFRIRMARAMFDELVAEETPVASS